MPTPAEINLTDLLAAITAYPFQNEGTSFLIDHRRAILADAPGLGKTVQSIGLMAHLHRAGQLSGVGAGAVVVCDGQLVAQWAEQFGKYAPQLTVATHRSLAASSQHAPDVLIVTYDWLRSARGRDRELRPALVVLDEAMAIKSSGKRWEAVVALTAEADRVVALTATPVENHPMELYAVLSALHLPDLWTQEDYERLFVAFKTDTRSGALVPAGLKPGSGAALREYVYRHTLRRTTAEVGLKLPNRVGPLAPVHIPETAAHRAAYLDYRRRQRNVTGRRTSREQLALICDGHSSVADYAIRYIAAQDPAEKVVVYCEMLAPLDHLSGRLHTLGIGRTQIDGDVPEAARDAALERFRTDPACRVLLGTRVLERGLNLQHARRLVSLGMTWNPAREEQREGRICRIGSPHDTYEHLVLLPDNGASRAKGWVQHRKNSDRDRIVGP